VTGILNAIEEGNRGESLSKSKVIQTGHWPLRLIVTPSSGKGRFGGPRE